MLSKNDVFHKRTRHIQLKHHFIRALIKNRELLYFHYISYVPTAENVADIMTKTLGKPSFIRFKNMLVS